MPSPNLFQIATKELSQDAFITWLLQWAAPENQKCNPVLHECAQQFVRLLIGETSDFEIISINAGRQWNKVDVWAEINDEILLIIEDKKHAGEHGNQLDVYRDMAKEWCCHEARGKTWKLVCVYLKTGNDSAYDLEQIRKREYQTIRRADLLKVFRRYSHVSNDIFADFVSYLDGLEEMATGCLTKPWVHWESHDWEGFYLWIESQEGINKNRWFWVDSTSGGFWAYQLNWEHHNNLCPLFLQIESDKKMLCIKISTDIDEPLSPAYDSQSDARNAYYHYVLRKAKEAGLTEVRKPDRFGTGAYMTVAVIDPKHWLGEADQPIQIDRIQPALNLYNDFVRKCAAEWNENEQGGS